MKSFLVIIFFIFFIFNPGFSQLKLTVKFNKNLDPAKIKIFYSDGSVKKFINPKFLNNTAVINEIIKSRYARLIIMYPDKFGHLPGLCFLVNKEISFLQFNEVADSFPDKLSNYKSKNLIDVKNASIYKHINSYTKKELTNFNKISAQNNLQTDSISKIVNKSYVSLALKQIEFIKSHGKEYFYFEKFINEIVPALKADYLFELYEIFNNSFPLSFKESYEGKAVKTLLEGNLYVKVGMQCPQFKTFDYSGKEISSENLKDKYYILSFWATWCSPCLKEIPQLKKIRDSYNENQLSIISITRDTDSIKFIKGINNYKMNWNHIFNSPVMENLFGEKPIPSLYLINKNGKIIFSTWENEIKVLDEILKNELVDQTILSPR